MSKPSHEDNMDRYNANRGIITDNNLAVIFILHGPFQYDIGWNKSPNSICPTCGDTPWPCRTFEAAEQLVSKYTIYKDKEPTNCDCTPNNINPDCEWAKDNGR